MTLPVPTLHPRIPHGPPHLTSHTPQHHSLNAPPLIREGHQSSGRGISHQGGRQSSGGALVIRGGASDMHAANTPPIHATHLHIMTAVDNCHDVQVCCMYCLISVSSFSSLSRTFPGNDWRWPPRQGHLQGLQGWCLIVYRGVDAGHVLACFIASSGAKGRIQGGRHQTRGIFNIFGSLKII